jgi:hypothetical protein
MNWKIAIIGGVVLYVTMFIVGFGTGHFIHSPEAGVLAETYRATSAFWRPELNAVPPDMMALLPMWVTNGLITAIIMAGIYSVIRSSLAGAAWQRGLKFGVIATLFWLVSALGYWGVFNLPGRVWLWWGLEGAVLSLIGGIALGIVAQKLAPAGS